MKRQQLGMGSQARCLSRARCLSSTYATSLFIGQLLSDNSYRTTLIGQLAHALCVQRHLWMLSVICVLSFGLSCPSSCFKSDAPRRAGAFAAAAVPI